MVIGERLKDLREQKNMSQGDIEKRTGLLRCYISRVENGRTVPAIETLEKLARAMEVPIYALFDDGEKPPAAASGGAVPVGMSGPWEMASEPSH
jgi:transcriptional regulator with XRE-family HTH domain